MIIFTPNTIAKSGEVNLNFAEVNPPYKARAYLTANQNLVDATWAKVLLNAETYDVNSDFDSTTNYRYTAPVTGYYQISAGIDLFSTASLGASFWGGIRKNGGATAIIEKNSYPTVTNNCQRVGITLSDVVYLVAGDYIELWGYIDVTGNTPVVIGGERYTYLSVHLLST